MPMKELNVEKTQRLLNRIMEFELAGVVRYTHYSLMVVGPNRIPIVQFMQGQANESLLHAQQAGEILTGLGGHPSQQIAPIDESHRHNVRDILEESLAHENRALALYKELLDVVANRSVYLEEFARSQIGQEELHSLELRKMLRDITPPADSHHAPAVDHVHDEHGNRRDKKPKKHKSHDEKSRGEKSHGEKSHGEKRAEKNKHAKATSTTKPKKQTKPAVSSTKNDAAKPAARPAPAKGKKAAPKQRLPARARG